IARREVQGRTRRGSGARLSLRELRRQLHASEPRPDRRQLPRQSARLQDADRRFRGQGDAVPAHGQMVRQVLSMRDRPLAARRRRLAWQLCALQIRSQHLLACRLGPVRSSRPVDLHGADGSVGGGRRGERRFRHLPRTLAGRRTFLPAALVPHERHVGVHGAHLWPVRRQAGRLRAGRREPSQLHAAAWSGSQRLREGLDRGAQAAQARRYAGLHVRNAVSAAPHSLRRATGNAATRLRGLLEGPRAEVRQPPVKLASLKHGRDGKLVVVSRDLTKATSAAAIAPTLQAALDSWAEAAPRLAALADQLARDAVPSFAFREQDCAAPLPRAYQWLDGSAYLNHVGLGRKARGAEMPPNALTDPLMYQGSSDAPFGPRDPILLADEAYGADMEAEVAVI